MRYAIFFTAGHDSELARLGDTWLGRDAFSGNAVRQPAIDGISARRLAELTASPRRYGFHATMKAPFRLKRGRSESALLEAFDAFCAKSEPASAECGLLVGMLGRFLALTPKTAEHRLNGLANECVQEFEKFRQPLTERERKVRKRSSLTVQEDKNLQKWGYPYVFDAYRFHVTLSKSLTVSDESDRLATACRRHFSPIVGSPFQVDRLAIFVEPEPGAPFIALRAGALTGTTKRCRPGLAKIGAK